MNPHYCKLEDAPKFWTWIKTRQGLAIWKSLDLSDPGRTWTTPVLTEDGKPFPKAHWAMERMPCRIITDPKEVLVAHDKEVKRFHVAVRMGAQGLKLKLTDASSKRVRREVEKAGKGAYFEFCYPNQECVIMAPDKTETLEEWAKREGK